MIRKLETAIIYMPNIMIDGPVGQLEVLYTRSPKADAPLAIVMHPHPEHGGTMHNKVVYTMSKVFQDLGFHVVRFNFRGVGKSDGNFDFGAGELQDALVVYDWFRSNNPASKELWAAGFSFGSWVAMRLLMQREGIHRFVCAGPPASVYDFSFLAPCPCAGVFIQGTFDEIVLPDGSFELAKNLSKQERIDVPCIMIEGGDHFFTGRLDIFSESMKEYIKANTESL